MKTLRLVAMILALTALPVEGQWEFSGGMNLSQLSGALGGSDLQSAVNQAGMVFGIDLVIPFGGLGLNLGADWSQKGVEDIVTDPTTQQQVLRLIDLNYIEVPVHVRVPVASAGPPPRSTSCSARRSDSEPAVRSPRASPPRRSVARSPMDPTSRKPTSAARPVSASASAWAGSYTLVSTCAIRPG